MSRFTNHLIEKYSKVGNSISRDFYDTQKKELSEEDFKQRFYMIAEKGEWEKFYEKITDQIDKDELMMLMLDKLLEEQKVATDKLKLIAGLVLTSFLLSIIGAIIIAVVLT